MSGGWFDWLNSQPGGQQPQGPDPQTQQTGYLPPEQWQQQQMAPQAQQQQMNPAQQQMPPWMQMMQQRLAASGGQPPGAPPAAGADPGAWIRGIAGSAGMSQDQISALQNALRQHALGQAMQNPSLMGQLTQGLGQQRPPDFSGGGPSFSPYAMPGTVRYNPNG